MTSTINSPASAVTTQKAMLSVASNAKSEQSSKIDKAESKRLDDAARQFEAVFLRQMLSCLERTTSVQGGKEAGSNLYGSMMVDAVADAVSRAGGIGLGTMLAKSVAPQLVHQVAVPSGASMKQSNVEQAVASATLGPTGPSRGRSP
jgi:Rod binding domain-containing protein